jgi:2-polyprenyl-6-methoxyphenol hydroxylase-like FAD-dependent oxidoreductase
MYDAIVIGARCAGTPTAMLLARRGHRVVLIDRAVFPSDTMSTHLIHPYGVAALRRSGVLDDLIASGVPVLPTLRLDFGPSCSRARLQKLDIARREELHQALTAPGPE